MKTAALLFGLVISITAVGYGQGQTVTNATLEKFQKQRLAAERDYKENYERMGFPSPEELDRQRDADLKAKIELAEQLRQARLEKEQLELERQNLALENSRLQYEAAVDEPTGVYGGYWGGFAGSVGHDRFGRSRSRYPFRNYPGNRLRPTVDRSTYRFTPFGAVRVPTVRPATRLRSWVGRGRRR